LEYISVSGLIPVLFIIKWSIPKQDSDRESVDNTKDT